MPVNIIQQLEKSVYPLASPEYAEFLDKEDKLSKFRQEFVIPTRRSLLDDDQTAGKTDTKQRKKKRGM